MNCTVIQLLFLVAFAGCLSFSTPNETNVTDAALNETGPESFTTDGWLPLTEEESSTPLSQETVTDDGEPTENWSVFEEESTSETSEDVFLREGQLLSTDEPTSTSMEALYSDEYLIEPRLRIERSPYSAELYMEDEFGLEFLCAGYWLREDVLLIRADCWPENVKDLNTEDRSVAEVYENEKLNLRILWLLDGQEGEWPSHFVNIRDESPSLEHCALYVMLEDDALFEKWTWSTKPIAFRRASGPCGYGQFCLRVRPSSPNGRDYALVCEQSLVGMLNVERTKLERVFGRVSLLDVTHAKQWIEQVLEELEGGLPDDDFNDAKHDEEEEEEEHDDQIEDEAEDQEYEEEKIEENHEEERVEGGKEDQDVVPFLLSLVKFVF
uniref:Peptidase S1 domain-containing protein n=1 Tax=Anopheles atroparvus TaxID=41427 RepID=A0AAG5DM18_ANOAO